MIDMYDIEFTSEEIPLGPEEWRKLPGHKRSTQPVNRQKVHLDAPGWAAKQSALMLPDSFRIMVCPPKVLGHWNAFGPDDLRAVVCETAPAVLAAMGITVKPEILDHLAKGNYRVREVHIAHQFWLHDRSISDFLDALFRRLSGSHFPERLRKGRGFRLNPSSRVAAYLLYDKLHELRQRGLPFYAHRVADCPARSWERLGVALERDFQRIVAAAGPRLEVRLGDHFFKLTNSLSRGSGWRPSTADTLYLRYLKRLDLPAVVPATYARVRAEQRLGASFKTYLLWAAGHDLKSLKMGEKTIRVHCREVQERLGINMRSPATAVLGHRQTVNAAAIFDWGNRVIPAAVDRDEFAWLGDNFIPAD